MREAGAPFADFIAPFLSPGRGLAGKTRDDYARYLREFDAFTGHTNLRAAFTLENAQRFRDRQRTRPDFVTQWNHGAQVDGQVAR